MITVNNLTKRFGDLVAVNDISFAIRKGEITGLLGPNGAGKTTTLRMLTCYLAPDAGSVVVGDYLASMNPIEVRRIIGYLPESAPLYADMIVYDYLWYVGQIREIPAETLPTRIREIANVCGLAEVMHKNIGDLSKGYKQRVGLAHAMIHDPEILILDEPTSGLDPNQIVEIRNVIKEIGKRKTVILSTHILSEVEATCDRVIIIDRGKIAADSTTRELTEGGDAGNSVTLRVSGVEFGTLADAIRRLDGVSDIREAVDREGLTAANVLTGTASDVRPSIFRLIADKGWTLYEMKQEQQTLENIFRKLTRGGEHEA